MRVALDGIAGLLSIARLLMPSTTSQTFLIRHNWRLRGAAVVVVVAFATILGSGLRL